MSKLQIIGKKEKIHASELRLNMEVFHENIYHGRELMTVVGIRETSVELRGDYSGGTNPSMSDEWYPIDGIFRLIKVCDQHVKYGSCPLPNIHCSFPNCEPSLSSWGHYVKGKLINEVVLINQNLEL